MGMDRDIPASGIFPLVEADEPLGTRTDMSELQTLRNYESVETQLDEAMIEIDRYLEKGFVKMLPLQNIHEKYPAGTASRLALILKQKADGSTKRRIVIDMRRSLGNERAHVKERIVLPRAQDIVSSLLEKMNSPKRNLRQRSPKLNSFFSISKMRFAISAYTLTSSSIV